MSLDLGPGRHVGVTGPSGSGKTTLAALLMRFIDPRSGSVTLDGTDLRRLALDDVRRVVGLVDDDPYVFSSSVAENIRLARPDADDDGVEHALRAAQLGTWLDALPNGLATLIGEGNALVSGGERARIGIARSLLADQHVLVLDEPTAQLDTVTAAAVTDDLLVAARGRSLVWITHGTIGLAEMDTVIRLDSMHAGQVPAGSADRPRRPRNPTSISATQPQGNPKSLMAAGPTVHPPPQGVIDARGSDLNHDAEMIGRRHIVPRGRDA